MTDWMKLCEPDRFKKSHSGTETKIRALVDDASTEQRDAARRSRLLRPQRNSILISGKVSRSKGRSIYAGPEGILVTLHLPPIQLYNYIFQKVVAIRTKIPVGLIVTRLLK